MLSCVLCVVVICAFLLVLHRKNSRVNTFKTFQYVPSKRPCHKGHGRFERTHGSVSLSLSSLLVYVCVCVYVCMLYVVCCVLCVVCCVLCVVCCVFCCGVVCSVGGVWCGVVWCCFVWCGAAWRAENNLRVWIRNASVCAFTTHTRRHDELETKRMRICGLEVNDDRNEKDARPEEGEWATDDMSGEFIDASEVRAARKGETEFMNDIELCEDSTAEDCWSGTGTPPVSTKWIDSKKGSGRIWWPGTSWRKATAAQARSGRGDRCGADQHRKGPLGRQGQARGWRQPHQAAGRDGWRLREPKAVALRPWRTAVSIWRQRAWCAARPSRSSSLP